jgi:hypothetical protein
MADDTDVQKQWQIDLNQLLALMRNVVVNHERIRERILALQEQYYNGEMGDGGASWERWAVAHFAYSASYLRFMTRPRPLQLDKGQRKIDRETEKARKLATKEDAKRVQEGLDLATARAERAEQQVRDLTRELAQERQRAAQAEALPNRCARCDKPLPPAAMPRQYCSGACRVAAFRARR